MIERFFKACQNNNLEKAEKLLEDGIDINLYDSNGKTFLMYACEHGNLDLVKHLLDMGGEIHTKDYQNKTCLMYACKSGNLALVKYLEKYCNKDFCESDIYGENVFMRACESGSVELVKYLIYDLSTVTALFVWLMVNQDRSILRAGCTCYTTYQNTYAYS